MNASLNIYGPIDDHEYWKKCRSLLSSLPKNVSFTYHGAIEHSEVASRLKDNDLLFFPTRNENFGHVIIEAIQAGLFVLTSNRTPWATIEENQIGSWLPLEAPKKFIEKIEEIRLGIPKSGMLLKIVAKSFWRRIKMTHTPAQIMRLCLMR